MKNDTWWEEEKRVWDELKPEERLAVLAIVRSMGEGLLAFNDYWKRYRQTKKKDPEEAKHHKILNSTPTDIMCETLISEGVMEDVFYTDNERIGKQREEWMDKEEEGYKPNCEIVVDLMERAFRNLIKEAHQAFHK